MGLCSSGISVCSSEVADELIPKKGVALVIWANGNAYAGLSEAFCMRAMTAMSGPCSPLLSSAAKVVLYWWDEMETQMLGRRGLGWPERTASQPSPYSIYPLNLNSQILRSSIQQTGETGPIHSPSFSSHLFMLKHTGLPGHIAPSGMAWLSPPPPATVI